MKRISLRTARQRAHLTQEQLQAAAGVPQEVISRIETGATPNPSFDTVTKLAAALNIDPRRLKFGAQSEESVAS